MLLYINIKKNSSLIQKSKFLKKISKILNKILNKISKILNKISKIFKQNTKNFKNVQTYFPKNRNSYFGKLISILNFSKLLCHNCTNCHLLNFQTRNYSGETLYKCFEAS